MSKFNEGDQIILTAPSGKELDAILHAEDERGSYIIAALEGASNTNSFYGKSGWSWSKKPDPLPTTPGAVIAFNQTYDPAVLLVDGKWVWINGAFPNSAIDNAVRVAAERVGFTVRFSGLEEDGRGRWI